MGTYLQQYGVEDVRRNRKVKIIVTVACTVLVTAVIAYFVLHNYFEKRVAKDFLSKSTLANTRKLTRRGAAPHSTRVLTTITSGSSKTGVPLRKRTVPGRLPTPTVADPF